MKDLINRLEVIDALDRAAECWNIAEPFNEGMRAGYKAAVTIVLSLPSAQPERERGRWIPNIYPDVGDGYRCSQCGKWHVVKYNFCHNCGADMREVNDGQV